VEDGTFPRENLYRSSIKRVTAPREKGEMTIAESSTQLRPSADGDGTVDRRSVAEILRLLGGGATGSILLALGEGSLRTKALTTRVPGYAPRTVYRYVGKLVEIGVIEREEEPGVPSKVVHRLADPCGVELHDLIEAYAGATPSLERLPDGGIVPHSWGSLTLLADLWESGMFEELNAGPCTATELARVDHGLSFHQVSRRTNLLVIGGLIRETWDGSKRRRYALTAGARQGTALIAGLGEWRERHVVPTGKPGLTVAETAELLRAALPLVVLPKHAGKSFRLTVTPPGRGNGNEGEVVWAEVRPDGAVASCAGPMAEIDGWGRGTVESWIVALLQGAGSKVRTGGADRALIRASVRGMHEVLWKPQGSAA
jgi:DNA-binding HxlR family transcriptional regulator